MKRKRIVQVLLTVLVLLALAAVAYLAIRYAPQLKRVLTDPANILQLERWIDSFGIFGIIILFLLQVVQVFVAIIPSEPIEVAAGISYGGFWGFAVCLAGVFIGSLLVFKLIRRFGTPFVEKLVSEKKLREFKFIHNVKRVEGITFLLYFIPGLPKDVFTYFAALTSISQRNFLLISLVARIPSILVSTIAGAQYMEGNYRTALIIFGVFAVMGLLGMVIYRSVTAKLNGKEEEHDTGK